VQGIAKEIASDELKHVKFIRLALGSSAIACPKMNIGSAFSDAADAALGTKLSPRFSPYAANKLDLLFLHGEFNSRCDISVSNVIVRYTGSSHIMVMLSAEATETRRVVQVHSSLRTWE